MDVAKNLRHLAGMIDHTNLRPDATRDDIKKLCEEAVRYRFRTICIHPDSIRDAQKIFSNLNAFIPLCAVVGFPHGRTTTYIKVIEAQFSSDMDKAEEIDMVMNISKFKDGDYDFVELEIKKVRGVVPGILKVIIETGYLTDDEIQAASLIAQRAGADYVKTSTGFGPRGASVRDIQLIRSAIGNKTKIKAAGGIKTFADAQAMMNAGVDCLGTSNSVAIMEEARNAYEKEQA